MLDDFYDKFYIIKICFSIIIRNIFWAVEDISNLAEQVVYEEVITGTKGLAHECSQICDEIGRDERDFGLETETETRVVSVSVSAFETRASKSQSQSQFSRPKEQSLSLSLKI